MLKRQLVTPVVLLAVVLGGGAGCDLLIPVEPPAADAGPDAGLDAPPPDEAAPTTVASPAGGVHRALPMVTLGTSEPATIYYTVDGSAPTTDSPHGPSPLPVEGLVVGTPLRFFAVDEAGNAEEVRTESYTLDRFGPAPVDRLRAVASGADVALSWSPPAAPGMLDVVVARVTDVAAAAAVDGRAMALGDDMGVGRVVYVGPATSFTDLAPGPGHHTYVAWAHYRSGVFADGRVTGVRLQPPAQDCSFRLDVGAGTVTVGAQPSAWTVATSGVTTGAGTVDVSVALTSRLAGVTFNPKLVITSVTGTGGTPSVQGASGTLTQGTATGPFVGFGPRGLVAGATVNRPLRLATGGASAIDVRCTVVESEGLFYAERCGGVAPDGGGVFDLATSQRTGGLPVPARFAPVAGRCAQWQTMILSPDGRYLYAGPRSGKVVTKLDTTTFAAVAGLDVQVATTSAAASRLALDPSGRRLYVGVTDGAHGGGRRLTTGNATLAAVESLVLEVDAATMTERRRMSLGVGNHLRRLARLALAPDGRTVAVLLAAVRAPVSNSELHLLDASRWTEVDTDPLQAGGQRAALGTVRGPSLTFDRSGRYLLIGQGAGATADQLDDVGLLDLRDYRLTALNHPRGERVIGAYALEDRFLLLTRGTYLATLDPDARQMFVLNAVLPNGRQQAAVASRDGQTVLIAGDAGTSVMDLSAGVRRAVLPGGPASLHVLASTP